jgi:hypothetical protein
VTALPSSGTFAMVDPSHVAAVGPAAAILFARIAWRAKDAGEWRATRGELAGETGLTAAMIRTAVDVLREHGWVATRRTSTLDSTLIWEPVFAGQAQRLIPLSRDGEISIPPLAESAIPSIETGKTISTPRPLRVVGDDEKAPDRPEVVALCERLADRVEANGSKRPVITKAWLTSCRLLIDKDGRPAEKVALAIDWCQADDFWRANVLSMPTLRKQYDRLRLAAQRDQGRPRPAIASPTEQYDPAYAATLPPAPKRDLYA